MVAPTCESGLHSASRVFDDEEEEIDIMNHSDDDEPLNNNLITFGFQDQIISSNTTITTTTHTTTTPKRMLIDSEINVLKLKQKNNNNKSISSSPLSFSTSSLVPISDKSSSFTSSCVLSSSTSSLITSSKSSRNNNNKKKAKQTKYPRNEGPSDESSDSSSDELKSFVKDVKARDYWEKYERRMYQEQMEKRKNVLATKWLVTGNRRTPSQLQKDKELERLMVANIFAPVPKDIIDELEESSTPVPKVRESKVASYRELPNYTEEDGYDDNTTSSFFKQYKTGRVKCEWNEPELSLVHPSKPLASYFPSLSSSSSSRSNPSRSSSRNKDLKSSSSSIASSSSSIVPPRRRIKNEEDYDNGTMESEEEQTITRPRRNRSAKPITPAVSLSADSEASGSGESEEDDEDYEGSEQEIEEIEEEDEDFSERDDGECSSTNGTPLKRKGHAVARSKAKKAQYDISAAPLSSPSSPATPACSSPDSSLSAPSSPTSQSSFSSPFFSDNLDSPLFPMSPTLSLPSPFGSPISSPLILTHHHSHSSPSALFDDMEGTLDFDNMEVKLEGDGELDLELGLGLGLDVDLRKSSSSISDGFGWGSAVDSLPLPSSPTFDTSRRPSPPPPLAIIKAESTDADFSISKKKSTLPKPSKDLKEKDSKDKDALVKSAKIVEIIGKDGKKKRPTLPKEEKDIKVKKESEGKCIKEEKEEREREEKEEKEKEKEKEKEREEEDKEDDDKADLEPSLKRAKRFCMDSKVQKHFQLTLWYDEEKVLFKELFCAFGRDWSQISVLMCGTKSPTQIKNFYYDVRRSLLTCLFGSEELAHLGGALPAIEKESEKEKLRRERLEQEREREREREREAAKIKEEKYSDDKDDDSDKEKAKEKKRPLNTVDDKDKAGPPKKKSKSGNMIFKFKYQMPAPSAPIPPIPAVPPVGANVYCQYRHAPGWVEASILALKGTDADIKAKLLVKGLPHYRAFWATPTQIKYSLEEGTDIFEYSAEDSEIEKNSTPPNNTYTPSLNNSTSSMVYQSTPIVPPPPPVIPPNETKLVAVEEKCKILMDTLVPIDRNKLYQWFENKLESMNAAAAAAAASSSSSSSGSSSSSVPSCASPTAAPISAPNSPPVPLTVAIPSPASPKIEDIPENALALSSILPSLSSTSTTARYKSYLECVSAVYEEKDLININFVSVFGTTLTIGNRDLESAVWIRRHFDTLLTAVDQGVTLILSRSSANNSRRVPPTTPVQPTTILPKKIMPTAAISPIPQLPSTLPVPNVARISTPAAVVPANVSSIVAVTASSAQTPSTSIPHQVVANVASSSLVAKTPAAIAAATLNSQPSMIAQSSAVAAGMSSSTTTPLVSLAASKPAIPATPAAISSANSAAAAAAKVLMSSAASSTLAVRPVPTIVGVNAKVPGVPSQLSQVRPQVPSQGTTVQTVPLTPSTPSQLAQQQQQSQLKLQTSPIVIQKQTPGSHIQPPTPASAQLAASQAGMVQTPVTTTPLSAGAQALVRAQLTQSAPMIASAYARSSIQNAGTPVIRPAIAQQMVPQQQPVAAQQLIVSQVVPQQAPKPLYTMGPATAATSSTTVAASNIARPQVVTPQLRQLLPASTATVPATASTVYSSLVNKGVPHQPVRPVLTQSAPQLMGRVSTPASTTPSVNTIQRTPVSSNATLPVVGQATPSVHVVSTATNGVQTHITPATVHVPPSVYIPPRATPVSTLATSSSSSIPSTTSVVPTTTPVHVHSTTPATTVVTPQITPTTVPAQTTPSVVMARTGPMTYPYISTASTAHGLVKSGTVSVNAPVPPSRATVKVNMPIPANAHKLAAAMTAVTAPGTPSSNSVTTSPYGKPGMKASNTVPSTVALSTAYTAKPCATCVNTKHMCTPVTGATCGSTVSAVSANVQKVPTTIVTGTVPTGAMAQNIRAVSTVASVLSGAALAGSQAKPAINTNPLLNTVNKPVPTPTPAPTSSSLNPLTTAPITAATLPIQTAKPPAPKPATPTKAVPNTNNTTKNTPTPSTTAPQANSTTQGTNNSNSNNNNSNNNSNSSNNSNTNGNTQGGQNGTSFGVDKNPAPYKLFIAKRELTLECRRLLRARCESMSTENKKNIENSTSTKDILSKMAELTNQLVSFKVQLFSIAGERYTVFKDHVSTPSTSSSSSSTSSTTSTPAPSTTTPSLSTSSSTISPPTTPITTPPSPTKVPSISSTTADIFMSLFDDGDLLMEDVENIDYFDI